MGIPRPKQILVDLCRRNPELTRSADRCRDVRGQVLAGWPGGQFPDWPEPVYIPTSLVAGIVPDVDGPAENPWLELAFRDRVLHTAALLAWRPTQGIYRFDPTLLDALWHTSIDSGLPDEILRRLPEWGVYIETPEREHLGDPLHGYFAYLDFTDEDGWLLCLLLDLAGRQCPMTVPLSGGTITQAMRSQVSKSAVTLRRFGLDNRAVHALGFGDARALDAMIAATTPLVSLLIYLCSTAAELRNADNDSRQPSRPAAQRTKRGERLFPPNNPVVWEAEFRLGAALRRAWEERLEGEFEGTHSGPRPHIRRAHWHGFWTGPKDQPAKRRLAVRWMAPIAVAVNDTEDIVPVIRPVN